MTKRSMILIVALLALLPLCAVAQPAKSAAPAPKFKLHPWWNLTPAQIKQYFQEGRDSRNDKNLKFFSLFFSTNPDVLPVHEPNPLDPSLPTGFITRQLWLFDAGLEAPPFELRVAGNSFKGIKKGKQIVTDDAILRKYIYDQYKKDLCFDVNLQTSGRASNLKRVKFLIENNLGDKASAQNLRDPKFYSFGDDPVIKGTDYGVGISLNTPAAKKLVSADAKWLRIWIIAQGQRLPVTFWLNIDRKFDPGKIERISKDSFIMGKVVVGKASKAK